MVMQYDVLLKIYLRSILGIFQITKDKNKQVMQRVGNLLPSIYMISINMYERKVYKSSVYL